MTESSNAAVWNDQKQTFTITLPFHPLHGQSFELVHLRQNWGEHRAYYQDGDGNLASIPVGWTDIYAPDPFVVMARGRALFRAFDLVELTRFIREMES
ncbi:MAG: hypothetical protein HQL73_01905 [Magnetococcales bacterium]|nr:hypothetical protein [Magnetococcales bacterium]